MIWCTLYRWTGIFLRRTKTLSVSSETILVLKLSKKYSHLHSSFELENPSWSLQLKYLLSLTLLPKKLLRSLPKLSQCQFTNKLYNYELCTHSFLVKESRTESWLEPQVWKISFLEEQIKLQRTVAQNDSKIHVIYKWNFKRSLSDMVLKSGVSLK